MRAQPSIARCIEARSVRSPRTTSASSRRSASARSSSCRTRARTLRPLASSMAVILRPTAPISPAAPVTRIGRSREDCIVISLNLVIAFEKLLLDHRERHWVARDEGFKSALCSTVAGALDYVKYDYPTVTNSLGSSGEAAPRGDMGRTFHAGCLA